MTSQAQPHQSNQPVFKIKAQDKLSTVAIEYYLELCYEAGLDEQVIEVQKALDEFEAWQLANPYLVKLPNHKHVPANQEG